MLNAKVILAHNPAPMEMLQRKIAEGKSYTALPKGEVIFSQGAASNAMYFIVSGSVKITVHSEAGREAVLAVLGPQDFFGEECIVAQLGRTNTATALTPVTLLRIEQDTMLRAIQDWPELSLRLMRILLIRKTAAEEDVCDQIFNPSEKRLARALLKLVRVYEPAATLDTPIPALSHETLSEMVGTTRSRVTFFMNKFRKLGLIDYRGDGGAAGRCIVHTKRLTDRMMQI